VRPPSPQVPRADQVIEVINKEGFRQRPEGINTVQLLKHCSSRLGLGPNEAMNLTEKLYLGGYITYPRTETTMYHRNFDFLSILHAFAKSFSPFAEYAAKFIEFGFSLPIQGYDAGDHPPITPTPKVPARGSLPGGEGKIYDFICRQFLGTISTVVKFDKTKIVFQAAEHIFHLHGTLILDPGFTEIVPWVKVSNRILPPFEVGDKFKISDLGFSSQETAAPSYLSESELISLMEKHGIGTDASMATHINNICQRNFVEVTQPGRRLKPTALGNALIMGYRDIDPELVSAELRSNIEKNVGLIAKGKANYENVLETVLKMFHKKFRYFKEHAWKLDSHFTLIYGTFNESLKAGVPFSRCGRCKLKMTLVEDFNKIFCKNCKLTLNLPRDSKYSLEGEDLCAIDGFQIINYYICKILFT
jgi:DNA topoisomerase-3